MEWTKSDERAWGLQLWEGSWPDRFSYTFFSKDSSKSLYPFVFPVPNSPLRWCALAQIPSCLSKSSGVSCKTPSCDIKNEIPSISITFRWWDLRWEEGRLKVISTPPRTLCLTCWCSLATSLGLRAGGADKAKASSSHDLRKGPIFWRTQEMAPVNLADRKDCLFTSKTGLVFRTSYTETALRDQFSSWRAILGLIGMELTFFIAPPQCCVLCLWLK